MKKHLSRYVENVLSLLHRGGKFTAREISSAVKDITPSEAGAILKQLRNEGKVKSHKAENNQHSQEWEGVK